MQVKEIMTKNVECIQSDKSVSDAAKRMKLLDIGAIPVCGLNDKLIGIVTDRDIAVRCIANGRDPQTLMVEEIMTPGIAFCQEDQNVFDAADMIKEQQIRRLVVINGDKRLVGILSLGDLAVRTNYKTICSNTLEGISKPSRSNEKVI